MTVVVRMEDKAFTRWWCHYNLAVEGWDKAIEAGNVGDLIGYGNWIRAAMTEIRANAPEDLDAPDTGTGGGVSLNLTTDDAKEIIRRGIRNDERFAAAVSAMNVAAMTRAGGKLIVQMNRVFSAAPSDLEPDGSEVDKP
ncbi:MAG: hypothetical protein AAF515_05190 [Pseudomonadota bacterium]